jgi:predicted RNA-binding protein with PUA-like domain
MKKGDLAFFYHSSCKVPAIVGIMEIVEEHSPDRKFRLSTPLHFPIIQNHANITKSQHMILQHHTTILLLTLITPNGQSYM